MPRGEPLDDLVLRGVHVLKFVHQHVIEALLPPRQPLGVRREQRQRVQQQVVEVHGVGLPQDPTELLVAVGRDLRERRVGVSGEDLGRDHPVLGCRDEGMQRPRRVRLGGEVPLLQHAAQQLFGVLRVVNRIAGAEAEQRSFAAQQACRERMEGADPQPARVGPEQGRDAPAHLFRGLVGKGDGEDAVGAHAAGQDQVGDARRQHARLPRPGARQHQQRPAAVLDRGPLGVVEREGHAEVAGNSITKVVPGPAPW